MKKNRSTYQCPSLEKVVMDNDISLALESPFADPELFNTLDLSTQQMPTETLMPTL
jgi:hypothetical protein